MNKTGKQNVPPVTLLCILIMAIFIIHAPNAFAAPISLAVMGDNYDQSFNTLASSGSSSSLPPGWAMNKTTYTAGPGSSSAGGMKSYGPTGNIDRALGSLTNDVGTLIYGAEFQNNTGMSINFLDISYTGEQWRKGTSTAVDTLFFQYSLNATSLTDSLATWVSVSSLNFVSPKHDGVAGSLNGNLIANRASPSAQISGLNISDSSIFWIRWNDLDIPSFTDHGLAIDDFNLTPTQVPVPGAILLLSSGLIGLAGLRWRFRK